MSRRAPRTEDALLYAEIFLTAMGQQVDRIMAATGHDTLMTRSADALMFVSVARNFRRAIEFAANLAEPAVRRQVQINLEDFDEEVPDLKQVRDIFEHFDDYELGRGRAFPDASKVSFIEANPHEFTAHVIMSPGRWLKVPIRSTYQSARNLYGAVENALADDDQSDG